MNQQRFGGDEPVLSHYVVFGAGASHAQTQLIRAHKFSRKN